MRSDPEAGFTLVELLVALALLALLSALLFGGLRMGRAAVTRSEAATEELQRTALGLAVARRELEQANPLPLGNVTDPRIAFAGDAAGVVFVAPPGAYLALGGDEITWLAIEGGPQGARLVLRYRPLDRQNDRWPPTLERSAMQTVVLLDGLARAEFAYFGRSDPAAGPQWQSAWQDAAALPLLIRISVAGGGVTWPDLVVAPRLGRPLTTGLLPSGVLCRRGMAAPC